MTSISPGSMTRFFNSHFSDNHQQHEQDDFIVEISLFDEFEDEDESDTSPLHNEQRILH